MSSRLGIMAGFAGCCAPALGSVPGWAAAFGSVNPPLLSPRHWLRYPPAAPGANDADTSKQNWAVASIQTSDGWCTYNSTWGTNTSGEPGAERETVTSAILEPIFRRPPDTNTCSLDRAICQSKRGSVAADPIRSPEQRGHLLPELPDDG